MGRGDFRGSACACIPLSKGTTNRQFSGLLVTGAWGRGDRNLWILWRIFFPPLGLFCFLSSFPAFLKMQFVKMALSSVWTRERLDGPLYVNTG